MTIILPSRRLPRWRKRVRLFFTYKVYRPIRGKIDYKWSFQQFAPEAKRKDIRKVTYRGPDGKAHKFVEGKVPFRPFTFDSAKTLNQGDLLWFNPVGEVE